MNWNDIFCEGGDIVGAWLEIIDGDTHDCARIIGVKRNGSEVTLVTHDRKRRWSQSWILIDPVPFEFDLEKAKFEMIVGGVISIEKTIHKLAIIVMSAIHAKATYPRI